MFRLLLAVSLVFVQFYVAAWGELPNKELVLLGMLLTIIILVVSLFVKPPINKGY